MNYLAAHNRIILVLVCIAALLAIYGLTFQIEIVARISIALIFPAACIWYSEELGHVTGVAMPQINQTSPGLLVAVAGWILIITILTAAIVINLPNSAT